MNWYNRVKQRLTRLTQRDVTTVRLYIYYLNKQRLIITLFKLQILNSLKKKQIWMLPLTRLVRTVGRGFRLSWPSRQVLSARWSTVSYRTVSYSMVMPHSMGYAHFAESQFAENPCNLLIFLRRKCRWRQTKLTLTVTLTLTDTVTVIFLRAFRWHP